jgi:hypothetical protein
VLSGTTNSELAHISAMMSSRDHRPITILYDLEIVLSEFTHGDTYTVELAFPLIAPSPRIPLANITS